MSKEADHKPYADSSSSSSSSSSTSPKETTLFDHSEHDRDMTRSPSEFELDELYHDEEDDALLAGDQEKADKPDKPEPEPVKKSKTLKSVVWTLVNVLATVLIVRHFTFHLNITILTSSGLHKQSHLLR